MKDNLSRWWKAWEGLAGDRLNLILLLVLYILQGESYQSRADYDPTFPRNSNRFELRRPLDIGS